LAKGFHYDNPKCFRCGDCCTLIPPEVSEEEVGIIKKHLNAKERKLFEASLTTDFSKADPRFHYENILPIPLTKGVAWIQAPCLFLEFEERKGKKRATCKLFKVRPRVCQRFFCGKESKEEHLNERQYKFELTPEEETELKKMDAKSRTEFHKWFKWRHPYVSIGG